MNITEIKIIPISEDKLKAFVTITIDNCFVIKDLKIIQGPEGLFLAMPSKKLKDGQFRDLAHPINQQTRIELENLVFAAYEKQIHGLAESLQHMPLSRVAK